MISDYRFGLEITKLQIKLAVKPRLMFLKPTHISDLDYSVYNKLPNIEFITI